MTRLDVPIKQTWYPMVAALGPDRPDAGRGHTGGIYRADNWEYVGKTKAERTYQIRGKMTARKAGGNTRTHAEMLALGAVCIGSFAKHKFINCRHRSV